MQDLTDMYSIQPYKTSFKPARRNKVLHIFQNVWFFFIPSMNFWFIFLSNCSWQLQLQHWMKMLIFQSLLILWPTRSLMKANWVVWMVSNNFKFGVSVCWLQCSLVLWCKIKHSPFRLYFTEAYKFSLFFICLRIGT